MAVVNYKAVRRSLKSLRSQVGSALVGFIQAGAGAVVLAVQDVLRERISTKQFGAVADGVTDDTAALQAALDAAAGKVLYFGPGTFKTGQLEPSSNTKIILHENTVLDMITGASNFTVFYIDGKENVEIDGNGATLQMTKADYSGENHHGININASTNWSIRRLKIKDCGGDGIYIGGASSGIANDGFVIDQVVVDNCRRNGVSVTFAKNGVIKNCVFKNMIGALPESGIDLEPNVGTIVENVKLVNNVALDNNGDGFIISYGPKYCSLEGCKATGNAGTGFKVAADSDEPTERIPAYNEISNCTADDNVIGFYVYYANDTRLIGNTSTGNSGFGMQIQSANGTSVVGNTVDGNSSRGIAMVDCTQTSYIGNHIRYNTAGGLVATGTNTNTRIIGNEAIGNYDLAGTYDANFHLLLTNAVIEANIARIGDEVNQPDYGLFLASGSTGVVRYGNDFVGGGLVADSNVVAATVYEKFRVGGWVQSGNGNGSLGGFELPYTTANSNSRSWRVKNDETTFGDFVIAQATTAGGSTYTTKFRIDPSGNILMPLQTSAPSLTVNGNMVFALTSNTNLKISVRGSDGTTRTADITLA